MSSEKSDALVIRQADFSETSRVVTLFTREFGKIAALAKGAKRLKGPFEAALDLLAHCRIVFLRKSSGGLDLLTEAQLISRFKPRERDLASLYGGYYIAELLDALSEDYDPHPVLFDESVAALQRLSEETNPRLTIVRFELVLLREIGQLPAFEECVVCGTTAEADRSFAFWVSQGGLICKNCQREDYTQNRLHAGTIAILKRLAAEQDPALPRLAVTDAQLKEMRTMTTAAISHILGRRPRTLRYLPN
jgi:DNA repair protein RecO (recombination protein O)